MKEIYDWVRWFQELTARIADGREAYLNEKARQVNWGENLAQLRYGDEGIDPFSFLYFLASKAGTNQLETVFESVSDKFGIKSPLPDPSEDEYYIFPTPPGLNALFRDGENFHNDLLWRLFRQAVPVDPEIEPNDFKDVLDIKGVGVPKLTQALFLINPGYFQSVDNTIDDLSAALGLPTLSEIQNEIKTGGGYENYQFFLEKLKIAFPGCKPYEINMFLYMQKSGSIVVSDDFYQVSTQVMGHGEGDYWDEGEYNFRENYWVYTGDAGGKKPYRLTDPKRGDVVLVRTGKETGKATGRAIGVVYRNDYVAGGWEKERRIHVLWINKSEGQLSGDTPILGFSHARPKTRAAFEETPNFRPSIDLIEKLKVFSPANNSLSEPDDQKLGEEAMENRHPLNQILYGPPGTGKTWNTVDYALAITEDESVITISNLNNS